MDDDWLGRGLAVWTGMLARRRLLLAVLLVLSGVLFSWLSRGVIWQPDVLQFFSGDSADVRSVRAAGKRTGLINQLRLDVHAQPEKPGVDVLAATKELAESLRATGEFRTVWTGVETGKLAASYGSLVAQGPLLLDPQQQADIETRATADPLRKRFAVLKEKLADPDGELLLAQARHDPLDISAVITDRLHRLAPTGAQGDAGSPTMDQGVLVTRDSRGALHAMIVAEPCSLPSDQQAASKTLAATNDAIARATAATPGIGVWMVGAHRGYVENAHRVKEDVAWISMLGSLAVGIAIALYFRRVSTALLCLIPATVGVGVSLGLAGILHVELPLILLGFAGLLCGSTTDYGIQMIAECRRLFVRRGEVWDAAIPAIAAQRMLGPISMSVATSVTGFAALGLSDAPGLRALGLFVAAATVCIWAITFLVLPAYLGPWVVRRESPSHRQGRATWKRAAFWGVAAAFVGMTVWLGWGAARVRFNADGRALDGASTQMLADEQAFSQVWGNLRHRAIVLAHASTADAALDLFQKVDRNLRDLQRDGQIAGVTSAAAVLPDQATVNERAATWRAYWTPERRTTLRENLAAAATANGFRPAAFSAYADRVADVMPAPAMERLTESPAALFPGFVDIGRDGTDFTLAGIVQMREDRSPRLATGWGQELRLRLPEASGVTVLSGDMLMFDATERARAEAERLGPLCLLVILLPLWVYFRKLRRAWLAMVCLLVGFVWVLGAAQLLGGGLNVLSLVPVLFTLGVAVDYGIYAASDPAWADCFATEPQRGGGRTEDGEGRAKEDNRLGATFVCALTTILGAGSLALASHPALRWLGITLVAGILGGYLASFVIVAPWMRWRARWSVPARRRPRVLRATLRAAVGIVLLAITALLAVPPIVQWILSRQRPAGVAETPVPLHAKEISPRVYAQGKSWMRWRETSKDAGFWEIAIVGDAKARGQALGAMASPVDVRIENEMLDQLDYFLPREWSRWLVLRGVAANLVTLPRWVPAEERREIYWAATSYRDPHAYLSPSYPRILSYHALHDISQMLIDNPLIVPNTFACTGVVSLPRYSATADGHLMLGRVFDFEGGESFGRQKSLTYVIPPAGDGIPFAHVAWPGLAGCVTGMNAERLALFINAAATKDFRRIGTPTILMARQVLQHARTIDEAERIIQGTQVFVSDIVVVADGKTGQARVFEKSPAATAAYDVGADGGDGSAVVTNHLLTPTFANDPVNKERKQDGTTLQRYARARQLLDGLKQQVTVERLVGLLRDKKGVDGKDLGYGNRNAVDGLIACHGVIMDVTAGRMWVAGWPNVEGAFVGADVLAMLKESPGNPGARASVSPEQVPPDRMMVNGDWERVLASREAAAKAEAALKAKDAGTAETLARTVIRDNPGFYLGHELLGRALFLSGDRRNAAVELSEALSLDPPYTGRRAAIQGLMKQCDTH